MTEPTNGMLNKIQALLNLAERASTPQEAEVASGKAAALMAKYSISRALLDATRSKSEREKPAQKKVSFIDVKYGNRKMNLLYNIAKLNNCDGVRINGGEYLHLFGFQSDLDVVEMLYYSLLVQAERALAQTSVPGYMNARSYRTAWWAGYINRIVGRLTEMSNRGKAEAVEEEPGTALVLRDRNLAVRDSLKDVYAKTQTRRTSTSVDLGAFRAGQAAGNRADLGGTRIGSRSAGALR